VSDNVVNDLQAESLLKDSHILIQVQTLRNSLQFKSNGEAFSFDDYYTKLRKMVDDLPRLSLEVAVAPGTENEYTIKLIKALEDIYDDIERVTNQAIDFEARLKDALGQVKRLSAAFKAWYIIACQDKMAELRGAPFLPADSQKALAEAEFSSLMGNKDVELESLAVAVKVMIDQIKIIKKTQNEKFSLGKDQANASWTNQLPHYGEAPERANQLVKRPWDPEIEEEEEEVSEFVSKKPIPPEAGDLSALLDPPNVASEPGEIKGTFHKTGDPVPVRAIYEDGEQVKAGFIGKDASLCSVCNKPQFDTPSGITCENGHGGAPNQHESQIVAGTTTTKEIVDATDFGGVAIPEPVTEKDGYKFIPGQLVIIREKDGQLEKIHCDKCGRRIRIGQRMYEKDEDWFHADVDDCKKMAKSPVNDLGTPAAQADMDAIAKQHDEAADVPPPTLPLEETTSVLGKVTPPDQTLLDTMEKAKLHVITPEEKHEQRISFAAGNLAMSTGEPIEVVKARVREAAKELYPSDPQTIASEVHAINHAKDEELPPAEPRKRLSFLDEDEEIL